MSMTNVDVSVAQLRAMLDGGDDDDWVAVAKVRVDNGAVVFRLLSIDGDVLHEVRVAPSDTVVVHYTLDVTG